MFFDKVNANVIEMYMFDILKYVIICLASLCMFYTFRIYKTEHLIKAYYEFRTDFH